MCVSHAPLHRICSEWHENKNSSCMLSFISYSIVSEDKCVLGFNLKSLKFTSDANAIFYILHTCPLMWCFLSFGSNIFFSCKSVWVDVWMWWCMVERLEKAFQMGKFDLWMWQCRQKTRSIYGPIVFMAGCLTSWQLRDMHFSTHTHSKTKRCPNSFLPPILAKLKPASFPVRFYYP